MICIECGFGIDEMNESQPVCPRCGTDPYQSESSVNLGCDSELEAIFQEGTAVAAMLTKDEEDNYNLFDQIRIFPSGADPDWAMHEAEAKAILARNDSRF
jgi:NADH pyrophosphatase NudC (nudix superfamily)